MAERKPRRAQRDRPDSPPSDSESGPTEEMDQLFRPLEGPDVRVRLDRQDDTMKRWVFHGYLNQEEARDAVIAEKFGGGTYRAQLTQRDPTSGSFRIQGTKVITLPGVYKPPQQVITTDSAARGRPTETNSPAVERTAPPVSPNEILSQALVSQVLDVMRVKQSATPSFDWGPVIIAGLGVLKEFMVSRTPPPTSAPSEGLAVRVLTQQLDELREEMRASRAQPTPTTNSMNDVMGAVRSVLELRDLIGGGGSGRTEEEPDAMGTLLTRMLDMLGTVPKATPGATAAAPVPVPSPSTPKLPMWALFVRQLGPFLVSAAREMASAVDVADSVAGLIPAQYVAMVEQFLAQPNAVAMLIHHVPELQEHGSWVTQFVTAMRNLGADDDAGEPDADDSGGGVDTGG